MLDISGFIKAFKSFSFPTKFHAPLESYSYLNTHQKKFPGSSLGFLRYLLTPLKKRRKILKNSALALVFFPAISTDEALMLAPVAFIVVTAEYIVKGPAAPIRARVKVFEVSIVGFKILGLRIGIAKVAVRDRGVG